MQSRVMVVQVRVLVVQGTLCWLLATLVNTVLTTNNYMSQRANADVSKVYIHMILAPRYTNRGSRCQQMIYKIYTYKFTHMNVNLWPSTIHNGNAT